jgi:hypothetical protein
VSLLQLDEDLPHMDYINDLTNTFMNQWDKSKLKKRSGCVRPEWWLKKIITFDLTVGLCLNFLQEFWKLFF